MTTENSNFSTLLDKICFMTLYVLGLYTRKESKSPVILLFNILLRLGKIQYTTLVEVSKVV